MPRYDTQEAEWFKAADSEGKRFTALKQSALDRFSPAVLGLGDIGRHSTPVEAICAVFDLEGFTDFCRQVDPHLAVPTFMKSFLEWLFQRIREDSIYEPTDGGAIMYTRLPMFAKFMGDGALFLWDASDIGDETAGIINVATRTAATCDAYNDEFLPRIRRRVSYPPTALRCGVARGRVYSIGNGDDFVGPCINIAARLQKIAPGITHCFSQRGFDLDLAPERTRAKLLLKRIAIRGIGTDELVYIRTSEFEVLVDSAKELFAEP
jgi:class 3 adenylate cyclase